MRRRPSPAIVISVIALFVALGGSSYAAITVNGSQLKNGSVAGKKLKRNTLTGKQIRESKLGAVPNAKALGGLPAAGYLTTTGKAADADKLDGLDSTAFLGAGAKAADADKLDGKDGSAYSLANQTFRAGVANGVGSDAGCASGTLAIVVRDGQGNPIDHRFTFIVPSATPDFGQVRSTGSLRENSTNVTSVDHTTGSGTYCIHFTTPPTQALIESSVAAPHDDF